MCVGKPKMPKASDAKAPDPAIIRNPYLDGVDPATRALRKGRSTLRIERGSGRAPTAPTPSSPAPAPNPAPAPGGSPGYSPVLGGGGGGRATIDAAINRTHYL